MTEFVVRIRTDAYPEGSYALVQDLEEFFYDMDMWADVELIEQEDV